MKSMEYNLQRAVLWMRGVNHLINCSIDEAYNEFPRRGIAATRGYVSRADLFCKIEFEGKEYTALSGWSENTKGDLLKNKIQTRAGGDTRFELKILMKRLFELHGGICVNLISRNEMTYDVEE